MCIKLYVSSANRRDGLIIHQSCAKKNPPNPSISELLERVLLRLGNADSDEKLEAAVGKFLTPVILKMNSPHNVVRTKASGWSNNDWLGGFVHPSRIVTLQN